MDHATLSEKLVRSASQNECFELTMHLNEVEELFTGGGLMQALAMASSKECVEAIVNSKLFDLLGADQKQSMLSSAIEMHNSQDIVNVLKSKKQQSGGKRNKRTRRNRRV